MGLVQAATTNSGPPMPDVAATSTRWTRAAIGPEPNSRRRIDGPAQRAKRRERFRVGRRRQVGSGGDLDEAQLIPGRNETHDAVDLQVAVEIDRRELVAVDGDDLAGLAHVGDIGDAADHAGMGDDRAAREGEGPVAHGVPAAVAADHDAGVLALHGEGAHEVDAIEEQLGANLDDLVAGPPDQHVEARLRDGDSIEVRVAPVAEQALAVSGEVEARDRHQGRAPPGPR